MRADDSKRLERAIRRALASARGRRFSTEQLSWLAQLMTVWASGYLEASCRETVLEYAEARSAPGVLNYVDHQMRFFRSPRTNQMIELVGLFDAGVASELREFADGRIGASIDSIVTTRHALAHGRDAQVTVAGVRRYFEDATKFIRKMQVLMASSGMAETN